MMTMYFSKESNMSKSQGDKNISCYEELKK